MASSNPKYNSKAESQTKPKPEPKSPSPTTTSTPGATPPIESESTHHNLFTITTLHVNPSGSPTPVYIVRPTQIWDSLARYRNCIIPNLPPSPPTTLLLHDDISLHRPTQQQQHHHHRPTHHHPALPNLWYARILEIRASSASHVYLRIFWYYTPAQLPPGIHIDSDVRANGFRKSRGKARKGEVLPSNEMGVVSALDVLGRVEVGVGRKGNGDGDGALWRENRYDFWGEEVFEERYFPGETRGEHFEE